MIKRLIYTLLLLAVLTACHRPVRATKMIGEIIMVDSTLENIQDTDYLVYLAPIKADLEAQLGAPIGYAPKDLEVYQPECPMLNWASDALYEMAKQLCPEQVDMAVVNIGGMRCNWGAGDITFRHVFELMPFDNELVVLTMSGKEIIALCDVFAHSGGQGVAGLRMSASNGALKSAKIAGKNIAELSQMDIAELYEWLLNAHKEMNEKQASVAELIIKEIRTRLKFMLDVGLDYLSLNRPSVSLSGGENQRIRLATQIGSQLVNVLYILDEPSIGLHQRDNIKLIDSLKKLRDIGNSVIVVEHDKDMMLESDYIVDMGPLAGRKGGKVVFSGTPAEMLKTHTMTADYLNGVKEIAVPEKKREGNGKSIIIKGARGNNLKNVDVEFPLNKLVCVSGVSGSGKSTLVNETLQPILSQHFYRSLQDPLPYDSVSGIEYVDKVINVDQTPIGRTPRSNPATYTDLFTDIRNLFISLPESKMRGYKIGRFSFNVKGGRCENCGGNGYRAIEMNFLPDVLVPCEICQGKRYNRETLEIRFKGKSIADVLDMTINMAVEFFENIPNIYLKVKTLQEIGLGYIKLGQPSTTLSGGESQRIKLATELMKKETGNTLYILDEPTTGLHFEDIRILLEVLNKLVDKGNSVIVIEHNLDVIKAADYVIDIGPEGGRGGGKVVATGTPEEIVQNPQSHTGVFLKKELGIL